MNTPKHKYQGNKGMSRMMKVAKEKGKDADENFKPKFKAKK